MPFCLRKWRPSSSSWGPPARPPPPRHAPPVGPYGLIYLSSPLMSATRPQPHESPPHSYSMALPPSQVGQGFRVFQREATSDLRSKDAKSPVVKYQGIFYLGCPSGSWSNSRGTRPSSNTPLQTGVTVAGSPLPLLKHGLCQTWLVSHGLCPAEPAQCQALSQYSPGSHDLWINFSTSDKKPFTIL